MEPSGKHPDIIVRAEQPLNVEPPLELLLEGFVTPRELFYIRNHGNVPEVDADRYRLVVSGMVESSLELSLEEIRGEFPKESVTATLHCAGNRREDLMEVAEIPGQLPWGAGAIGNARWSGVPLREVLRTVGVGEGARHVAFTGLDEIGEEEGSTNFGGSVPIEKGTGSEILLAYEMNDEPLSAEHGFPLRVVVPGYIGARSVKWLSRIDLQGTPSDNRFQAKEYRLFPPHVTEEPADTWEGLMLGDLSVNAVICSPSKGETLAAGSVPVRGYTIAGGRRSIERVDLSVDEGRTWVQAELLGDGEHPWAWRLWEATLELGPGRYRIVARALDSAADTQPADPASIWNFKGYVNNAWHRVEVDVR